MAIVKWDPFKDLLSIQERINKIFEENAYPEAAVQNRGEFVPPVDVFEKENEIVLLMDIPGVSEEDIEIQVNDGVLSIKGEKKAPFEKENDNCYRMERQFGKFSRMFSLPNYLDFTNIKASLKDGLLKISIPKSEQAKAKVIKVTKDE
ncbi:Hsp20/alpha crystallin family protein [Calditerrivibrio nitroreducens]|uniref:Heat shock protein Hsp20 n=1 Tax=Calditerrivibrio nitroreducens (strain DSM 19672 / NBRC 101217 / Yu37-1) TaxID=768670 RepID=E4TIJ6_CALNY|nr:Hsp20/alpha crystallin family protein [Calditerrivibrio nitroreducens]ADR19044.1 heat shock protein Hsp20 [Calditerrivibrio nitroreducens DSM 19672]